jgi:hypothetical protein
MSLHTIIYMPPWSDPKTCLYGIHLDDNSTVLWHVSEWMQSIPCVGANAVLKLVYHTFLSSTEDHPPLSFFRPRQKLATPSFRSTPKAPHTLRYIPSPLHTLSSCSYTTVVLRMCFISTNIYTIYIYYFWYWLHNVNWQDNLYLTFWKFVCLKTYPSGIKLRWFDICDLIVTDFVIITKPSFSFHTSWKQRYIF